jgi:cardiolipin synthase (CMP-forming)
MAIMKKQYIPNIITCIRLSLIIPVFLFLMNENYKLAFYFFILAGLSDGLDGFLARRYQWTSIFGAIADPLADKLLMLVSYFGLTILGHIPLWLFIVVIFRDIWLVLGILLYRCFINNLEFEPTRISKINTVFQILLVVLVLLNLSVLTIPVIILDIVMYVVLVTTISSFLDYTFVWGRRAINTAFGSRIAVRDKLSTRRK